MWRKQEPAAEAALGRLEGAVRIERKRRWTDALEESQRGDVAVAPPAEAPASPSIDEAVERVRQQHAIQEEPRQSGLLSRIEQIEGVSRRLEATVQQLTAEVQRLSQERTQNFGIRPSESNGGHPSNGNGSLQLEQAFAPANKPVRVALSNVPDFQALMDIQRALGALLQADSAAVIEYENGAASLELRLAAPATPGQILDGVRQISGRKVNIEEANVDARMMRLGVVQAPKSGLRPELWARS